MDEARSSWNTVYRSREGFECQITLRDEEEETLFSRVSEAMKDIAASGGIPLKRKSFEPGSSTSSKNSAEKKNATGKKEKTFVDEDGIRRCNKRLKDGTVCENPVEKREGKYGPFWSCPNYKDHAG